jgi:hypothetical protein
VRGESAPPLRFLTRRIRPADLLGIRRYARLDNLVFSGRGHGQDLSSIASFTAASSCRSVGSLPFSSFGSFSVRWYSATPMGLVFVLRENSTTMSSFSAHKIMPMDGLSSGALSLSLSKLR